MRFSNNYRSLACVVGILSLSGGGILAQTPPDNTKVNQRDRQLATATADQQTNDRSDLETTRQIRRSVVSDKSLSTYGHNVKIITKGGKVTLRGPVRSEDEKTMIETKAAAVAGADNVLNELAVKSRAATSTKTPDNTSERNS
jgi:hyperosmotically inducible protein